MEEREESKNLQLYAERMQHAGCPPYVVFGSKWMKMTVELLN